MPAAAKAVPVKPPELKTSSSGVLDDAWLTRTLALPAGVALIELDLQLLRERVLADGQVMTAVVTRHFPARLVVQVTERAPVARVRVQVGNQARDLLVARDGVMFAGHGYEREILETLPWLAGLALVPDGATFRPITRMSAVAQLLADAQFSAEHLYRAWQSVSLARLESDDEIQVTMKDNTTVIFSAKNAIFPQLAKLDYMTEQLVHTPPARIRIDLSLGSIVPVKIESLVADETSAVPASTSLFPSPSIPQREL